MALLMNGGVVLVAEVAAGIAILRGKITVGSGGGAPGRHIPTEVLAAPLAGKAAPSPE